METAARLASARASYVVALENFRAAHRPADLPADSAGILAGDLPPPEPVLVSIVILTLNGGEMLRALFSSLAACNTWPDIEIIVVDHGSDDATAEVLRDTSAHFHIRHLKPDRNFSFAFSCNRGAQIARGEIVLFLNNDIEFTEDVIPRIVAGVQATGGLVGIKLLHGQAGGQTTPRPQIGVRFRWSPGQDWTAPYDASPGPRDALRAAQPCRMPVVTGAVLACNRAEFLKMGGFCEDYLYAYEDVDLGLKAAARFGLPSVSLNDVSALHLMGATRTKRSSFRRRRLWHRHSLGVLRARYGYRSRRLAWLGLFGAAKGFDWGRRPAVAFLADSGDEAAGGAAKALQAEFAEFAVLKTSGFRQYDLFGYDLVVSRLPSFSMALARNLGPMALKIGWIRAGDGDWRANAAAYDILMTDGRERASSLTESLGQPVIAIGDRGIAEALRHAVTDFLQNRFRIAVLAASDKCADAARLSAVLRAAGHAVRTGAPRSVSMRDEVAIWLSPPGISKFPVDTIHVAAFAPVPDGRFSYDIRLESLGGDMRAWFDRLMPEIADCHEKRMAGPIDLPLDDLRHADDGAAVWRGRHDPTAHLIGVS
ncbi:glycosyltransferase family 2 protein [Parvibaculum sp.]|uniref:glycosyltransferase family 2 protein n=1 Tax=Parvibaculum sp. TaxID=2024848 RepID=UPI00349FE966